MPETKEEAEKRALRELEGRNVAHYQVILSAWINSRMERDKTIITLSSVAIGLLVTVVTTIGLNGIWQYLFATIAFAGFIIAIFSCLHIYQFNAKHLEEVLRDKEGKNTSNLLKNLDKLSSRCFYIGVIFGILMALFISFQKTGSLTMSKKKHDTPKKVEKIQESLTGIKNLSPKDIETASVEGISNLKPENINPSSLPSLQDSSKPSGDNSEEKK